jgi:ferredoxin
MDDANQTPAPQMTEDKVIQVGKYKVTVLRHACIGAASCVAVSPGVFAMDSENKAVVIDGANDVPENILMAAQSCPTKAIVIVDTETGQQVWPA